MFLFLVSVQSTNINLKVQYFIHTYFLKYIFLKFSIMEKILWKEQKWKGGENFLMYTVNG